MARTKEGFVVCSVGGKTVAVASGELCRHFNGMITLNDSGAFLWKELEKGGDADSLTAALLREYEVDEATAHTCAAEFIAKLKEADCLAD